MSLYNTTLGQPFVFAAFLYAGIVIGLIHSAFRGIRRLFGRSMLITAAADVLFLAVAAGLFFFVMYRATGLRIRGYHFLGAAAGYALYSAAIRPLALFLNCKFRKKKIDNSRGK